MQLASSLVGSGTTIIIASITNKQTFCQRLLENFLGLADLQVKYRIGPTHGRLQVIALDSILLLKLNMPQAAFNASFSMTPISF